MPPIEVNVDSMLSENVRLSRFGCEKKAAKLRMPQFMNADRFKSVLQNIDTVLFDCDGKSFELQNLFLFH